MDYKVVRPMIKKLGIKGDPVTIKTNKNTKVQEFIDEESFVPSMTNTTKVDTSTSKNLSTIDQPITQDEVKEYGLHSHAPIKEDSLQNQSRPSAEKISQKEKSLTDPIDTQTMEQDSYQVGDIAKNIQATTEKTQPKKSKFVAPNSSQKDTEIALSTIEKEKQDMNSLLSSIKKIKELTHFEKPKPEVNIIAKKQPTYLTQPANPYASELRKLFEKEDAKKVNTTKSKQNLLHKYNLVSLLDSISNPSIDTLHTEKENHTDTLSLEKDKSIKDSIFHATKNTSIKPLPFSKYDMRYDLNTIEDVTDDERMKNQQNLTAKDNTNALEGVPFSRIDLRKQEDTDTYEWNDTSYTSIDTNPYTKGSTTEDVSSIPTQNYKDYTVFDKKPINATSTYQKSATPSVSKTVENGNSSTPNTDSIADDDLYGEVISVETVQPKQKKKFVPTDIAETKKWAWLAYLLFFIPLLFKPKSQFVRHSANEGLLINIVDIIGIVCIVCGAMITSSVLVTQGLLLALSIIGWILLILTTVTKIFMIIVTLSGKCVSTPWFWNIKIIR